MYLKVSGTGFRDWSLVLSYELPTITWGQAFWSEVCTRVHRASRLECRRVWITNYARRASWKLHRHV